MAWATSTRRSRLPANWATLRRTVAHRAHGQCQWTTNHTRCHLPGTDCDHIIANDDHTLSNLQWLCHDHHRLKTNSESAAGRRRTAAVGNHPRERHPGLC